MMIAFISVIRATVKGLSRLAQSVALIRNAWLGAVAVRYGFDSQYGQYHLKLTVALFVQCSFLCDL
jgi:hypothetical protein